MKKLLLFFVAVIFFAVPVTASAHVLKSDGSIGAVIHISPEDNPVAGEPATFFFEFKDKQHKFNPRACDCKISIIQDGNTTFSKNLFEAVTTADLNTPMFTYTFPRRAVYKVQVTGQSKDVGSFQSFTLNYDIRVEKEVAPATDAPTPPKTGGGHTLHYILFGGVFLVAFILSFYQKYKQKKLGTFPHKNLHITAVFVAFIAAFGLIIHTVHADIICSGAMQAQAHECCLPTLADTSMNAEICALKNLVRRESFSLYTVTFKFISEVANKSPPTI